MVCFLFCFVFVILFFGHKAYGVFPDQGLNSCPLCWNHSLNHWTTREVPVVLFCFVLFNITNHSEQNGLWEAKLEIRLYRNSPVFEYK